MANRKKRRRAVRRVERQKKDAESNRRGKHPFPVKKAVIVFLLYAVFMAVYYLFVYLQMMAGLHIYSIAIFLLAVGYVWMNRGYLGRIEEIADAEEQMLAGKRRKKSAILLYILIPLMLTVLSDMFCLFVTNNLGVSLL